MKPKFFKTQSDLRKWFTKNHEKIDEQWIGYYKKATKKASITWDESVEEALCFGWIDGLRRSIDGEAYMIRFTPRRPNSNWSLKNLKTMKMLIDKKLVQPAGMAIFEKRKAHKNGVYSFEPEEDLSFTKEYELILKKNKKAWDFYSSQSPSYKKSSRHWVMSAKQEKTRLKRLDDLIRDSENGLKVKPFRRPE